MSDEPDADDFYDEQVQRLHENPEQECVPGCWVCASTRWVRSDYVGPLVEVTK